MLANRAGSGLPLLSRLARQLLLSADALATRPATLRIMSAIKGATSRPTKEKYWGALAEVLEAAKVFGKSPASSEEHILLPRPERMSKVLHMRESLSREKNGQDSHLLCRLRRALSWLQAPPHAPLRTIGGRICIVGVHGWFPTKMLQRVVGVPRGTSTRLCAMMKEAVTEFLNERPLEYFKGPKTPISTVPLEGEGCIEERVARHYAQLDEPLCPQEGKVSWKTGRDLIQEADCVIFAAHSQGAPVTALLVERLIKESVLRPEREQNVGILTLAGVFHGPFPFLAENLVVKWVEADAARELFHLNDSHNQLSLKIQQALATLLARDVVMANVASWMDQVVPLHSAALLGVDHPHIWRSVYIDAHNYQPDFLSHMVDLALTLTNGRIEGGRQLLAQLGTALAGSIYQSNAHSTLYRETKVYQSILHWMNACDRPRYRSDRHDAIFHHSEMHPSQGSNPYELPWTMRGILSDRTLTSHPLIAADVAKLRELHRSWNPDRKIWKELKLQLQPLASKL